VFRYTNTKNTHNNENYSRWAVIKLRKILAKKLIDNQSGGVTVEFVLLLPIIFMLFVMIADFGSYLLKRQNLSSVTRGVITVVSNTPNFAINQPALLTMAQNALGPNASNIALSVNSVCSCNTAPTGCNMDCNGAPSRMQIQATISYDHTLMFPYPGINQTVSISDTLAFRVR
jgi:Flp pilus assembly protein TadG